MRWMGKDGPYFPKAQLVIALSFESLGCVFFPLELGLPEGRAVSASQIADFSPLLLSVPGLWGKGIFFPISEVMAGKLRTELSGISSPAVRPGLCLVHRTRSNSQRVLYLLTSSRVISALSGHNAVRRPGCQASCFPISGERAL